MSKSLRQFVIGFVIAFSLAPIIGVGAYVVADAHDSRSPVVKPAAVNYPPPAIEFRDTQQLPVDVAPPQTSATPQASAPAAASVEPHSGGEMEIETDCARKKRKLQTEKRKAGQAPKEKPTTPEL